MRHLETTEATPMCKRNRVISWDLVSTYTELAERLTKSGRAVEVTEAESQTVGMGEPLTNPNLLVVTLEGTGDALECFLRVASGVETALSPFLGAGPSGASRSELIEAAMVKGLENVAAPLVYSTEI